MSKYDCLISIFESCGYKYLTVKCHIFNITIDYLGDYTD